MSEPPTSEWIHLKPGWTMVRKSRRRTVSEPSVPVKVSSVKLSSLLRPSENRQWTVSACDGMHVPCACDWLPVRSLVKLLGCFAGIIKFAPHNFGSHLKTPIKNNYFENAHRHSNIRKKEHFLKSLNELKKILEKFKICVSFSLSSIAAFWSSLRLSEAL